MDRPVLTVAGAHLSRRDVVMFAVAVAVAVLAVRSAVQQHHADRAATREALVAEHVDCVRIEALKGVVRTQLRRALETLPTITYYKQHPVELGRQEALIQRELRDFAPSDCS